MTSHVNYSLVLSVYLYIDVALSQLIQISYHCINDLLLKKLWMQQSCIRRVNLFLACLRCDRKPIKFADIVRYDWSTLGLWSWYFCLKITPEPKVNTLGRTCWLHKYFIFIATIIYNIIMKGVAPYPTSRCNSYWKGAFGSPSSTLEKLISIYLSICVCVCVCVEKR